MADSVENYELDLGSEGNKLKGMSNFLCSSLQWFCFVFSSCGSSSCVDILVCTPGRLVDHISSTPNFTLHHVRFLVIDEADRLLSQSYHGWLGKVLKAAYNKQSFTSDFFNSDRYQITLRLLRITSI